MKAMRGLASRAAVTAAIALTMTSAALARPDTRSMTCERVQSTIQSAGAIVMTTGRHTYQRFVRSGSYCLHPDVAWRASVQARDTNHCPVLNCVPRNQVWPDDLFDRFP